MAANHCRSGARKRKASLQAQAEANARARANSIAKAHSKIAAAIQRENVAEMASLRANQQFDFEKLDQEPSGGADTLRRASRIRQPTAKAVSSAEQKRRRVSKATVRSEAISPTLSLQRCISCSKSPGESTLCFGTPPMRCHLIPSTYTLFDQ
jgi:hypothetical protein